MSFADGDVLTMSFLFERAFLQALRKRRIYNPTRLKNTIRSFHQVHPFNYPQNSISNRPSSKAENEDTGALDHSGHKEETMVSGEMAKMLMRRGFGVIPKCMYD